MRCMGLLKADVVVIGGGAAGSMCALTAAQRGLNVVLLEPNKMLGKKLRITGKGRCNVTNHCDVIVQKGMLLPLKVYTYGDKA